MARSQLPDMLRHNNKPPPDEVEKQLELPPGTLSCQLANYLLHPALSGQRSGVNTANAPQNSDSLNWPWPAAHGAGGCCYHLHRPAPPPRALSVKAKLQRLKQRFSSKASAGPFACPAAQAPAGAAGGMLQSPRQRWASATAVVPLQGPPRVQVATPPVRLNGAPLLMQHGGQAGSVPLRPLGVQKQPAQQLLPYTIDGGAAAPPPKPLPIAPHPPGSSAPPRGPIGPLAIPAGSTDWTQLDMSKNTADRPMPHSADWQPDNGAREKSKSITERDMGAVLPAMAWGGEDAIPSEEDLALPEPKSPFYPPRSNGVGGKLASAFPPCSSWTGIEPPPSAPSIPLSVLQAAIGAGGKPGTPMANTALRVVSRQLPAPIQPQPVSRETPQVKLQKQLSKHQQILDQRQGQHYYGAGQHQMPLRAAPTSDELSSVQLRAPESAFGVFDVPAGPAGMQDRAGLPLSAEFLPSARGSRTIPEDAGWNPATYQANNDLGPWQFAGLL